VAIAPGGDGGLVCQTLGIGVRLEGNNLVMVDLESGARLPTEAEAERAAKEAERAARRAAEAHAAQLLAELDRLRQERG
jgi:hypothetical protein